MRKATLVLATSVAFLLFGAGESYAGIKKKVQMPSAQSVAKGSGSASKAGETVSITGAAQGEYIPGANPSRTTPIKVLPRVDYSIPRTINATKSLLKRNLASVVVGGVISGLVAGLDWAMDPANNTLQKKEKRLDGSAVSGTHNSYPGGACLLPASQTMNKTNIFTDQGVTYAVTVVPYPQEPAGYTFANNCAKPNLGYTRTEGHWPIAYKKVIAPTDIIDTSIPVTDTDLSLIDAYANAQNADWLKDLIKESCDGSLDPAGCFESLKDNTFLSGPATVDGPSTITTTSGPGGSTTKETKTTYQITYGSDYFVYAPTTTTVTVNPDGTTDVETEEPAPEEQEENEVDTTLGDPYAPVVDQYTQIGKDLGKDETPVTFITYGPWYSFGGTCSPLSLELPVMGSYVIDHCYYVESWIRPTLAFLFAVYTWLHCFSLWRETIHKARPI